jgi:hypothetical protein
MTRYCKNCNRQPDAIVREAVKFFGPRGLGLTVKEEERTKDPCFACLSSDTGYIYITASKNESGSELEMETSDLDSQARQFLEII